jgi:hypothetical protein
MRRVAPLALAVLLVGGAGCTSQDSEAGDDEVFAENPIIVDGEPVTNAAEVLAFGEGRIPLDVRDLALCFFSVFDGRSDINPILRCGPELPRNTAFEGNWHTHELGAAPGEGGVVLSVEADLLRGWALLPGERVIRPDGAVPTEERSYVFSPVTATTTPPTGLPSTFPIDFQRCMAAAGFLVFEMRFLYDGDPYVHEGIAVREVRHLAHRTVSFDPTPPSDDAATRACMAQIAAAYGMTAATD